MTRVRGIIVPLAMLAVLASAGNAAAERSSAVGSGVAALPSADRSAERDIFTQIVDSYLPSNAAQVRIEQRVTIRIAPRSAPIMPSYLMDLPVQPLPPRRAERNAGRCLPIAGIAGVQVNGNDSLVLFMRDRRVMRVGLERSCSARDFYSGFYLERNADGQLCAMRDTLLSRSGANCRLSHIRQLVAAGN